jgi:hypothetical protein
MAKTVNAIPELKDLRNAHPWEKYLNGNIWELKQGKDFKSKPTIMAQQVYGAAKKLNVKASTAIRGNKLYIQAKGKTNGKKSTNNNSGK